MTIADAQGPVSPAHHEEPIRAPRFVYGHRESAVPIAKRASDTTWVPDKYRAPFRSVEKLEVRYPAAILIVDRDLAASHACEIDALPVRQPMQVGRLAAMNELQVVQACTEASASQALGDHQGFGRHRLSLREDRHSQFVATHAARFEYEV